MSAKGMIFLYTDVNHAQAEMIVTHQLQGAQQVVLSSAINNVVK